MNTHWFIGDGVLARHGMGKTRTVVRVYGFWERPTKEGETPIRKYSCDLYESDAVQQRYEFDTINEAITKGEELIP